MNGTVKWFSEQKGYGFIVDEAGTDHHFHVSAVGGVQLPRTGSKVTFDPTRGPKGPKASNVVVEPGAAPGLRDDRDDRATCLACHRRMVPRIITGPPLVHGQGSWTPVPKRSLCPFCGATYKKFPPSTGEKVGLVFFLAIFGLIAWGVLGSLLSR